MGKVPFGGTETWGGESGKLSQGQRDTHGSFLRAVHVLTGLTPTSTISFPTSQGMTLCLARVMLSPAERAWN